MNRLLTIVTLCIITLTAAIAQTPQDSKPGAKPVLPVQEKVYLHFDNNCYFQGDTIWYKAYVVLADDNSPEPLSRILYTELLNEQGYILERQQLVVDEHGQADGCYAVSDTAFAGFYEIRAYTKWMLNFGYEQIPSWNRHSTTYNKTDQDAVYFSSRDLTEGSSVLEPNEKLMASGTVQMDESGNLIFYDDEYKAGINVDKDIMTKNYRQYHNLYSRVLPVYNRPDSAQHFMRKVMPTKITMGDYEVVWNTPDFDMKFYPEGGALIDGQTCRVAWEAMNQQQERLNVTALLYEDDEVIDTLQPFYAGRGMFTFKPNKRSKYHVKYITPDKTFSFRLPAIMDEGARLIVEQDDEAVYFDVAQQFQTEHNLMFSIYCRGKCVNTQNIDNPRHWATAMYLDDLPEGVNQAIIHNADGTVYADRLFFVNKLYESKGKIMVAGIANRPYRPLEKIHLNLLATDPKGRPIADQTMSVSVRDADQLDPTFATGNILTNLLLESEVKGFIETPDYYFESNDQHHRQALDLLLMVQGWRRYNWKDIDNPEDANLSYLPEQKMVIYGEAIRLRKDLFHKDAGKLQISCSIINMNDDLKDDDYYKFKGVVEADSNGRFSFAYDPFYGNVILTLRAKFVNKLDKKKYDLLTHDDKIFIRKQYFYPQALKAYSWYETNSPDNIKDRKLTWEEFEQDIYASEWIPQVVIKTEKRAHARRQRNKPVYTISFLDYINDVWDQGFYRKYYLLNNNDFELSEYAGTLSAFSRMQYELKGRYNESALISVAGNERDYYRFAAENSYLSILKNIEIVSDAPRRPVLFEHHHQDIINVSSITGQINTYDRIINITTYPNDSTHITRGREYNFQGFTRPVEFYNPDYSHASLPEVHDYRRTLYWNPCVTTDRYGQASIEFYNNSVCTSLDVSAEGLTRYGQFLIMDE